MHACRFLSDFKEQLAAEHVDEAVAKDLQTLRASLLETVQEIEALQGVERTTEYHTAPAGPMPAYQKQGTREHALGLLLEEANEGLSAVDIEDAEFAAAQAAAAAASAQPHPPHHPTGPLGMNAMTKPPAAPTIYNPTPTTPVLKVSPSGRVVGDALAALSAAGLQTASVHPQSQFHLTLSTPASPSNDNDAVVAEAVALTRRLAALDADSMARELESLRAAAEEASTLEAELAAAREAAASRDALRATITALQPKAEMAGRMRAQVAALQEVAGEVETLQVGARGPGQQAMQGLHTCARTRGFNGIFCAHAFPGHARMCARPPPLAHAHPQLTALTPKSMRGTPNPLRCAALRPLHLLRPGACGCGPAGGGAGGGAEGGADTGPGGSSRGQGPGGAHGRMGAWMRACVYEHVCLRTCVCVAHVCVWPLREGEASRGQSSCSIVLPQASRPASLGLHTHCSTAV